MLIWFQDTWHMTIEGGQRSICYHSVVGSGKCKWSDVMGIMGDAKANEPNFEVHGLTGTQRGCGDVCMVFGKMGSANRKSGQFWHAMAWWWWWVLKLWRCVDGFFGCWWWEEQRSSSCYGSVGGGGWKWSNGVEKMVGVKAKPMDGDLICVCKSCGHACGWSAGCWRWQGQRCSYCSGVVGIGRWKWSNDVGMMDNAKVNQ